MSDTAEYASIVRRHANFTAWDDASLSALLERCALRVCNVGEVVWRAGEEADAAYILLKGRLERTRAARPDAPRTEQYAEPGTLLSLSALAHNAAHTSTATPLERTELLVLSREAFHALFEQSNPAAYHLVDALATHVVHEMRDANQRLHRVFGQPAETLRMLRRRLREEES